MEVWSKKVKVEYYLEEVRRLLKGTIDGDKYLDWLVGSLTKDGTPSAEHIGVSNLS
jgi:hypothetical protein